MCPKFTTSIVEKTFYCQILKNVSLYGSILEVLGQVWTREASIWIYFKIVGLRVWKQRINPKDTKQITKWIVRKTYRLRCDKHYPWNRSTILKDELGALGHQWSTFTIQQSDLVLGALCKRDVYSSILKKFI